ncbi:hypothetical protein BKA63DRAFT_219908 [Paraphoma chrysanthemicola]|nr:hypothetical protein BKA63DRAFT_219908 [Paraphoma chrysanthemicola]
MQTNDITPLVPNPNRSWSKEAIFALASIFVMVILSGAGLLYKYWHATWLFLITKIHIQTLRRDEEIVLARYNHRSTGWVNIDVVRQSQQRTYTSMLRRRRGPRSVNSY